MADTKLEAAISHHQAGRLAEAKRLYSDILSREPNNVVALHLLGVIAIEQGDARQATALIGQAIALRPDYAEARYNLGNVLTDLGKLDQAVVAYQSALELKPDFADARYNLGNALTNQGKLDEAAAVFHKALELKPDYVNAHYNLGNVLRDQGKPEDAVAAYRKALELKPDYVEAHYNLGNAHRDQGRWQDAVAAYRKTLELRSDYADAHFNLGLILLLSGDFEEGWTECEWRWRTDEFLQERSRYSTPVWDGAPLSGETIVIHAEQGIGDTLQFLRYAPLVAARGGRVVLECPEEVVRLAETVDGIDEVVTKGSAIPAHAHHAPLLSLPRIFDTTLSSIPAEVPYLSVPTCVAAPALDNSRDTLRVGIVWAGNPRHKNDRNRSCPLHYFEGLARRTDVSLYSLQVGSRAKDIEMLDVDASIVDLSPGLHDFADTAAVVSQVDLVITVDTALAHLAGALARPVWTLLPFRPDWRWLLGRDDSPWYSTMRLFRQARPGDWHDVFDRVGRALSALSAVRPVVTVDLSRNSIMLG